jgi:hypothetical protein
LLLPTSAPKAKGDLKSMVALLCLSALQLQPDILLEIFPDCRVFCHSTYQYARRLDSFPMELKIKVDIAQ